MRYSKNYRTDDAINASWDTLITNIDKYFHTPIVKSDDGDGKVTRNFIIPERKKWAFDMINRVWCNYDIDEVAYIDDYHPTTRINAGTKTAASTSTREYVLITQRYLNGNTNVIIYTTTKS